MKEKRTLVAVSMKPSFKQELLIEAESLGMTLSGYIKYILKLRNNNK